MAVLKPILVGVKATKMSRVAPGASAKAPPPLVMANSALSIPVSDGAATLRVDEPLF
jgi:hypothetical protein